MKMHVYEPADGYRFTLFQMEEKICSIWFTSKHILPFHHSHLLLPKSKKNFFAYTAQVLSEVSFLISLLLSKFFILINICKTANTWLNQFLLTLLYESYTCNSNKIKSIFGSCFHYWKLSYLWHTKPFIQTCICCRTHTNLC